MVARTARLAGANATAGDTRIVSRSASPAPTGIALTHIKKPRAIVLTFMHHRRFVPLAPSNRRPCVQVTDHGRMSQNKQMTSTRVRWILGCLLVASFLGGFPTWTSLGAASSASWLEPY